MQPGAWVMAKGRRAAAITAWGVTPQAQTVIGLAEVGDADLVGRAEMDRRAMDGRIPAGDLDRADRIGRAKGPHGHDERAGEAPGGLAGDRGAEHRNVAPLLDVPDAQTVCDQRLLEGKRAADGEGDEIVAPVLGHVMRFVHRFAVAPDPVGRQIGGDVEIGPQPRQDAVSRFRHAQQRAGFRVQRAEAQEVGGVGCGQDRQIRLDEARGEARRLAAQAPAARGEADSQPGVKPIACHLVFPSVVALRAKRKGPAEKRAIPTASNLALQSE